MLKRSDSASRYDYTRAEADLVEPDDELLVDLQRVLGAAQRQFKLVVVMSMIGLFIGICYAFTAQPIYTAGSELLIDDQQSRYGAVDDSGFQVRFDSAKIDSQLELLRSERLALVVVDKLDLSNNVEFMASSSSRLGSVIASIKSLFDVNTWLGTEPDLSVDEIAARRRVARAILQENLNVSRSGDTYVLNIWYSSPSPQFAAAIANAYGNAYLTDQLDAKYDATQRASVWLQNRIQELKEQSLASDLAVQKFRAENNLIAAGGTLVSETQLADMSSQLILAQAETAKQEARYKRIKEIIDAGHMNAAVTEALNNPVIADLRSKFLDASKRYAEISQRLGENHVQVLKLKNEMVEFERVIFDELRRISESYQSEYEIAKSREESLQQSVASLIGESASTNETLVTLRELEREAETYRTLYQSFLHRYQTTVQQQSFPVNNARIISNASVPNKPTHPKKSLLMALSLILGGMVGVGIGGYREFQDRGVRTGEQVRNNLMLEYLGLLSKLEGREIPEKKRKSSDEEKPLRSIQPTSTIYRQSIEAPLSSFAETLRSTKIAADLMLADKKPKIIGVTSVFPGEGKSTVSKNFASLLASLGARTLLIDCDLRNPGLSKGVASHAQLGLLDVVLEEKGLSEALLVEPDTKLFVLPTVVNRRVSHTSELLASPGMSKLLRQAGESFEFIVVDLPPLAPVVDVRAITNQIDTFLLVVEWGRTPRQTIRSMLSQDERLRRKCLGVVLNKVDTRIQKMYEISESNNDQYSAYSNYYTE